MVMMIFSFACRFVLGTYIQNSTGIKHDGDLTLGLATRCWRVSSQLELAHQVFILRHGFHLRDLNVHCGQVVQVGGEDLRLLVVILRATL